MKPRWRLLGVSLCLFCDLAGCSGQQARSPVDPRRAEEYTKRPHIVRSAGSPSRSCEPPTQDGVEIESFSCPNVTAKDFVATIPRLDPRSEIIRKGGDVGPSPDPTHQWFEFTPEIVGDHLVVAKSVSCSCTCDYLACTYSEQGGVFEVNPNDYFALGPNVGRDEAFEAVRLYREGRIDPADWFQPWDDLGNLRVEGVVSDDFDGQHALTLVLSSEACGFDVHVRIEGGVDKPRRLLVLEPVSGGCV
jgi:hypothetical protein